MKCLKIVLISTLVLLTACSVNETVSFQIDSPEASVVLESNSGPLAANVSLVAANVVPVGDRLKMQATIKNGARSDINLKYKIKWFDANDFELFVDGRPWTPLTITPYETKSIEALSPAPGVKKFVILVQDQ